MDPGGDSQSRQTGMLIEMTIKGLMVDPITNMPIIILRDQDGQKVLPIWVGRVRSQRHRAADREHPDAAADDARPAAQRHPGSAGGGGEDRRLRSEGEHVLRADPPADAGRPGRDRRAAERRDRAGAAHARADPGRGARHRQRQDASTSPTRSRTPIGCSSGSSRSTRTTWASTRCRRAVRQRPRRAESSV